MKYVIAPLLAAASFTMGCGRAYEPIDYGKDACAHCRMTIMDARFAAELITPKGKVYKFDDISCMRALTTELPGSMLFVNDYTATQIIPLNAATAVYLQHESFSSPMNGNLAAFGSVDAAKPLQDRLQLELLTWETLP